MDQRKKKQVLMICVEPVGFVRCSRSEKSDDKWLEETSSIILADHIPTESITNISHFSHLEIFFVLDKVAEDEIVFSGHPRGNTEYPVMGIFAQRKKDRPNRIGATIVRLMKVDERTLFVEGLDAIDGTPVIDIKPVFQEFLPKEKVRQPAWVSDLMKSYW